MDYAIIVAGGKGLRMNSDTPKQFLPIGGKPILMRTIERFREYSETLKIILVLPKEQRDYWQKLCREYDFKIDYQLTDGGATRFHSVQNGLALIPDDAEGCVAVHDGVRPFPTPEVISRCFAMTRIWKAVVPVIPIVETLREVNPMIPTDSQTVPRENYRLVQTPQTFDIQLLKAANQQPYSESFTDDASVVESYGHSITTVDGNPENIKITRPYDLAIAEALVKLGSTENYGL